MDHGHDGAPFRPKTSTWYVFVIYSFKGIKSTGIFHKKEGPVLREMAWLRTTVSGHEKNR